MSDPLAIRPETINLVAPLIRGSRLPAVQRITVDAPCSHRRAVYRLADSCRREMGSALPYGYDGEEYDLDHVAFLWVHPDGVGMRWAFRVPCVAATCFRLREEGWALQWVWLHPYFRRQGLLPDAWPGFVAEFGDFAVEGPVSAAVRGFLASRVHVGGRP